MLPRALLFTAMVVGASGCREGGDDEQDPAMKLTGTEGTTDLPMDSTTGPAEIEGDRCESARVVEPGRHYGAFAGATADFEAVCGVAGPDLFFQIELDRRVDLEVEGVGAGFLPIVAVLSSCDDDDPAFACAEGLSTTVLDLPAGSAPIVALAIRGDDPAATVEGSDLDVALDLHLRAVLGADEECAPPGRGRCESGTSCLPDDEGVERCTVLAADTCATAEPHALVVGELLEIEMSPDTPQTDAHAHTCTGARRSDRVLRLEMPADLSRATALRLSTDAADVGLAVRGASCLALDELGCAGPSDGGVELVVDDMAARLGSDRSAYVFIELPADIDPGELAPFLVTIELAPP